MGRAGAVRFAREGAAVGVVDIDEAGVASVVAEIEAVGALAKGIVADLTKDEDAARIVREPANTADGRPDLAGNHAGDPVTSIEGIDMRDFDIGGFKSRTVLTTEAMTELEREAVISLTLIDSVFRITLQSRLFGYEAWW